MNAQTSSYLSVFYDLRPAKQVERRMLLDAFLHLQTAGFSLRDYQYTGFGSIFFVDFILFHRLLGMTNLLSVERDLDIEKRVKFNRPFAPIEIRMAPIGDVIPSLDRDKRHLLWLDYDYRLNREVIEDVGLAASTLSASSLLLVTVDAEPPDGEGPGDWMQHYEDVALQYFDQEWTTDAFAMSRLPATIARILHRVILAAAVPRSSVKFSPLFSFEYADGHRMVTVGGMITLPGDQEKLDGAGLGKLPFIRRQEDEEPFRIAVPRLTRKERLYLDHNMPCAPDWLPEEFELARASVDDYAQIYRYYPTYAELLL